MSKFDRLPVEEDTTVLFHAEVQVGSYDAVYEAWLWDNIKGFSAIFLSEDVAALDEPALTELVRQQFKLAPDASMTFIQGDEGYTFVNFGFEVVEGC